MMTQRAHKVVVLGLGKTGLSCARWLHARGSEVAVLDSRASPPGLAQLQAELPDVAALLGGFDAAILHTADEIVVSPGVPLETPALAAAAAQGIPIIGDIELFRPRRDGTGDRHHRFQRQEHGDHVGGRDAAPGRAERRRRRQLGRTGARPPREPCRLVRPRTLELPARNHRLAPGPGGDGAESLRRSSRSLCEPGRLWRRQGAHLRTRRARHRQSRRLGGRRACQGRSRAHRLLALGALGRGRLWGQDARARALDRARHAAIDARRRAAGPRSPQSGQCPGRAGARRERRRGPRNRLRGPARFPWPAASWRVGRRTPWRPLDQRFQGHQSRRDGCRAGRRRRRSQHA